MTVTERQHDVAECVVPEHMALAELLDPRGGDVFLAQLLEHEAAASCG